DAVGGTVGCPAVVEIGDRAAQSRCFPLDLHADLHSRVMVTGFSFQAKSWEYSCKPPKFGRNFWSGGGFPVGGLEIPNGISPTAAREDRRAGDVKGATLSAGGSGRRGVRLGRRRRRRTGSGPDLSPTLSIALPRDGEGDEEEGDGDVISVVVPGRRFSAPMRPIAGLALVVSDSDDYDLSVVETIEHAEGEAPQDVAMMAIVDARPAMRLFISALALRRTRCRLWAGSTGTALGNLFPDVGPLERLSRTCVDLVAAPIDLVEPGSLDILAGKVGRQAGGQFLHEPLALFGGKLQCRFEDLFCSGRHDGSVYRASPVRARGDPRIVHTGLVDGRTGLHPDPLHRAAARRR